MRPQHRRNLKDVVRKVLDSEFSRIYIRFSYNNSPDSWSSWDERKYQRAWGFIVDARNAAREVVIEKGLSQKLSHPNSILMFDLGGEMGGVTGGKIVDFMKRIWRDYSSAYGVDDTVGFSFAWAPGRFSTQLGVFNSLGVYPKHWAFDIYADFYGSISSLMSEMGVFKNQPIHILETYFNDAITASHVSQSMNSIGELNLQFLGQWPLYSGGGGHFSRPAIDSFVSPVTFGNYVGFLARRKLYISSSNSYIISFGDINCSLSYNWPCSVRIRWGSPPPGRRYGIYVVTPGGVNLVHCEASSGSSVASWISVYPYYNFDVYSMPASGCSSPHPQGGAIKVASAEVSPFGY